MWCAVRMHKTFSLERQGLQGYPQNFSLKEKCIEKTPSDFCLGRWCVVRMPKDLPEKLSLGKNALRLSLWKVVCKKSAPLESLWVHGVQKELLYTFCLERCSVYETFLVLLSEKPMCEKMYSLEKGCVGRMPSKLHLVGGVEKNALKPLL